MIDVVFILTVLLLLVFWFIWKETVNTRDKIAYYKKELERIEDKYNLNSKHISTLSLRNKIPHLCHNKVVYLIDYENVGRIPHPLLEDKGSLIFVFVGNNQKEAASRKNHNLNDTNIYYFQMDKTIHNYLDIYLSCFVGGMISMYNPRSIRIVSKDKGFSAVIKTAKVLGFMDIDYFVTQPTLTVKDAMIKKTVKDIFILFPSSIKDSVLKNKIKTFYPNLESEEVDIFIERAIEIKCIEKIKLKNNKVYYKTNT